MSVRVRPADGDQLANYERNNTPTTEDADESWAVVSGRCCLSSRLSLITYSQTSLSEPRPGDIVARLPCR